MEHLLSAISVFLVFLTFLFNSIEKEVNSLISERTPEKEQTARRKVYQKQLTHILYFKALPITLIFIVTFYVLLPHTVEVLTSGSFVLWGFDEIKTLFVFIEFGVLGMAVYSSIKTIQLFNKVKKLKKES